MHQRVRLSALSETAANHGAPSSYRVTLKHHTEDAIESATLLKQCHKRCAERTLRAMEKNGSIFIKLGQHLSSLNYMLPVEWTRPSTPVMFNTTLGIAMRIGKHMAELAASQQ